MCSSTGVLRATVDLITATTFSSVTPPQGPEHLRPAAGDRAPSSKGTDGLRRTWRRGRPRLETGSSADRVAGRTRRDRRPGAVARLRASGRPSRRAAAASGEVPSLQGLRSGRARAETRRSLARYVRVVLLPIGGPGWPEAPRQRGLGPLAAAYGREARVPPREPVRVREGRGRAERGQHIAALEVIPPTNTRSLLGA